MIVIEKWPGLITNASPYALPGGAASVQVNVQCLRPGEIRSRAGLAHAATVSGGTVLSAVRYPTGATQAVLCQVGSELRLVSVP